MMKTILLSLSQRLSPFKSKGFHQVLTYLLAVIGMFLFLAVSDKYLNSLGTFWHFIAFMGLVILIGIVNIWLLYRPLYDQIPEWKKTLMTFGANLAGGLIFVLGSSHALAENYLQLFTPALIFFSLPWVFLLLIEAILAIPKLKYDPIYFDSLKDIIAEIDWAEDETRGIVWEFENLVEMQNRQPYWVRTHTPHSLKEIELEDLFKCLLSLHNHNLSPQQPIHFRKEGKSHGWRFFYEKNGLFGAYLKPLNPEKTLRQNGVTFHMLSKKERKEMGGIRKDLAQKFKRTRVVVRREV